MKFTQLTTRNYAILHGYDENNRELLEEVQQPETTKLLAIERIQSVTEKYVLTLSSHGRVIYWEYAEDFDTLRRSLAAAGLLLDVSGPHAEMPVMEP